MRVAIVTESFLPQVNGVTNSVVRLAAHLRATGHQALVIAPGPGPTEHEGTPALRLPSVPLPGYRDHRLGIPSPGLVSAISGFGADVVHLASPTVLGAQGAWAARRLGLPCIAVYQTDLAGFAVQYGAWFAGTALWRWLRTVHSLADVTLAPSTAAVQDLERHGVPRVRLWPRGVDLDAFDPRHRDPSLHTRLAGDGRLLVGYVGRLAPEKQVDLLRRVDADPGVRLVLAGDGPAHDDLRGCLPNAHFLGTLRGQALSTTFATLDVFVHTGPHETFCQSAQEALASGVPVVAPASGGLLDLVRPGVNGLLYPPGDAEALHRAVLALRDHPHLRADLAERTRASVERRSWAAVGDAYLAVCDELLTTGSRAVG